MLTEDQMIDVVICIYDPNGTYSRHAAVVMASIFMNTRSSVCIHIIHDDTLSEDNKIRLQSTADKFDQHVEFVNVKNNVEVLFPDTDALTGDFSRGSLFRLFIQELLPDLQRVIYLDCDIIVHMDIEELWKILSDEYPIAAVQDYLQPKNSLYCLIKRKMGLDYRDYFCSGVCVFNFQKIWSLPSKAIEFFKKYEKYIMLPDQDFLNYQFRDNWQKLPERFDKFDVCAKGLPVNEILNTLGIIWHLGSKPWAKSLGLPTEALYWHYLSQSAYSDKIGEYVHEAVAKSVEAAAQHPVGHKDWLRWLKQVIIWPFTVAKRHIKDWYIKITL